MTNLADTKRGKVVNWMARREKKFKYGNGVGKEYPDRTGWTDCSGAILADYRDTVGETLGFMSYNQATNGTEVASGTTLSEFKKIQHLIKPGDIVAMALTYGYRGGAAINHVELAAGTAMSWGHGGPGPGPTYHSMTISWLIPSASFWTVRRIIQDEQVDPILIEPEPETIIKPALLGDDDVKLVKTNTSATIWATNGMVRRSIKSIDEAAGLEKIFGKTKVISKAALDGIPVDQTELLVDKTVKTNAAMGRTASRVVDLVSASETIMETLATDVVKTDYIKDKVTKTNHAVGRAEKARLEQEAIAEQNA